MSAIKRGTVVAAAALVGAGSVLLASPAHAETKTVNALPASVKLTQVDSITLNVAGASVCEAGWTLNQPGVPGKSKQNAVTWSGVACTAENGSLVGTVTPSSDPKAKKNGVVKFTATNGTEKRVLTLVVHVAKPNANKPAQPGKPE